MTKEEFLKLRRAPQKPAFENDGRKLNLETHDMLRRIMQHKVEEENKTKTTLVDHNEQPAQT